MIKMIQNHKFYWFQFSYFFERTDEKHLSDWEHSGFWSFLCMLCNVRLVRKLRRSEWRMIGEGQRKWKLPVLTVLPVVVVSTLTSVTDERLVHAAGCVFTRVQQARVHAVTPKVTWYTAPTQTLNTFHTWLHPPHTPPRLNTCLVFWNVI